MSMEIPAALVSAADESKSEPNAISVRIETAVAVLFAVMAVVATSFVAALTGLI